MIISASRRTDIPCYYSEWFVNRLQAGYVYTRNPMNHSQVKKVSLSSDIVDCIVFWTKDATNLTHKLRLIDELGYKYCFQYTITPYNHDIERNLRPKSQIIDNFMLFSSLIGKHCLTWRYDPIIVNEKYTVEFHKEAFEKMCEQLSNYTERVIISFVDVYSKIHSNAVRDISLENILILAQTIGKISRKYGLIVQTCCESYDLDKFGISHGGCIDPIVIEKVCGYKLTYRGDKGQRKACNCMESVDVGAYNTCLNGCSYCYANVNELVAESNYKRHNVHGEFLIGATNPTDKISIQMQKSNRFES